MTDDTTRDQQPEPSYTEAPPIAPYPGGPSLGESKESSWPSSTGVPPTSPHTPQPPLSMHPQAPYVRAVRSDHIPFVQLVLTVAQAILLGVFVVAASATVGIVAQFVVKPSWPDWLSGAAYFGLITASYAVQILLIYWIARDRGLRFAPAVGLNKFPLGAGIAVAVVVSFVGRLLAVIASVLIQGLGVHLPQPTTDPTRILGTGPVSVVLVLVLLMVVAPLCEEIIFRGVIMGALHERYGQGWAIVGSGLLFALVHVQPATVFAIIFVGLALGWVAMRFRSIWPSMIAHSLFNGVSAGAIFYLRSTGRL